MMDKLLPCPFCGDEAETKMYLWGEHAETHAPIWCYYAFCRACDAMTDNVFKTEEEAIAAWNRRAGKDTNVATNADRMRSMSNMELAEMLVRYDSNLYRYYCPDGSFCYDEDSALSFALDWLDKPAKEE